jgi:hypothetical protein
MEASRGRKGKQGRWQLTLGVKDVIFAGLGLAGLMMMAFALGALAGRGDIYRVFYHWGLLDQEAARVAQWAPPGAAPPYTGVAPVGTVQPSGVPAPAAIATAPGAVPPVTGSVAALPSATSPPKKSKGAPASARDLKAREEELRRVRQEVVRKLKFQNSFDTAPKPSRLSQKPKDKATPAKTPATQVRVAQFRDSKAAQAKVAELEKKGIKATLKQGKDDRGTVYTVYKQAPSHSPDAERLAQGAPKADGKKTKGTSP